MSISLAQITSGYNLSKINSNFTVLRDAHNNVAFWLAGGNNTMQQDIDLNSNDLLNGNVIHTKALLLNGSAVVPSNLGSFAPNSVGTLQLVDGSVTNAKMAADSVTNVNIMGLIDGTKSSFIQAGSGATTRTMQDKAREDITPFDFGAVGDGVTDDSAAMQAAVNAGTQIKIPAGKTFKWNTPVLITKPDTKVLGPGTCSGQFVVAMPQVGDPYSSILARTVFQGVTFANCTAPIVCRRGRGILVQGCSFASITDAAVLIQPLVADFDAANHCVEDLNVSGNVFGLVDYMIRSDQSAIDSLTTVDWWLGNGDTTVMDNVCRVARITHLQFDRADGLVCIGNTFLNFAPDPIVTFKRRGVEINTMASQVIIKGNQFFGSGLEAIFLENTAHYIITDNNFIENGQLSPTATIRCEYIPGSGPSNLEVSGVISNNNIWHTTSHAIRLTNQSQVAVTDNIITLGTGSGYYYGTDPFPTFTSRYGVFAEASGGGVSNQVQIRGNICFDQPSNTFNGGTTANLVGTGLIYYDESTPATSINANYDQVDFQSPSAHTITTVAGGYDGKTMKIIAFNGNTTIAHNSNIATPTAANFTLVTGNIYTLTRHISGRWFLK